MPFPKSVETKVALLPGEHMKKSKFILSLITASMLFIVQVGAVFAAPAMKDITPIIGNVYKIAVESDRTTGLTTVLVKFKDENGGMQTVRLSEETAKELGLITLDGDGHPVINKAALGLEINIDPETVILKEKQHPVGSALTDFFSHDIDGLDYETIMDVHADGYGFGVIAQALWIIKNLGGDANDLVSLLQAKKDGNFEKFALEDGTIPTSWNQLRKAVAENLGTIMSHKDKENNVNDGNGNSSNENSNKDKNKNEGNGGENDTGKPDNGHGHGNSNKP
jgi:hypothetical protein